MMKKNYNGNTRKMICETCKKHMQQSYRTLKNIDNIKQCVECYWLIAFLNGHNLGQLENVKTEITDKELSDIYDKVYKLSLEYPQCSSTKRNTNESPKT